MLETLPKALLDEMALDATLRYPREACGYVLKIGSPDWRLVYYTTPNRSSDPCNSFEIDAKDWMQAEKVGKIVYVFHSHNHADACAFSNYDYEAMLKLGLPWLIYNVGSGEWTELNPDLPRPLLGREWVWGVTDCGALVRDALSMAGVNLQDYPRSELMIGKDFAWDTADWQTPFSESFMVENGFLKLPMPIPTFKYDVLLMSFANKYAHVNHCAIFWVPDRNIFYHHLMDRLSEPAIWGDPWDRHTISVWRHKELFNAKTNQG